MVRRGIHADSLEHWQVVVDGGNSAVLNKTISWKDRKGEAGKILSRKA